MQQRSMKYFKRLDNGLSVEERIANAAKDAKGSGTELSAKIASAVQEAVAVGRNMVTKTKKIQPK